VEGGASEKPTPVAGGQRRTFSSPSSRLASATRPGAAPAVMPAIKAQHAASPSTTTAAAATSARRWWRRDGGIEVDASWRL